MSESVYYFEEPSFFLILNLVAKEVNWNVVYPINLFSVNRDQGGGWVFTCPRELLNLYMSQVLQQLKKL